MRKRSWKKLLFLGRLYWWRGRTITYYTFSPVVEEEFLVADILRYPESFPEPFFIGPVSEWNWEVVTLLCSLETWTFNFTVCGVLLTSSWSFPNGRPNNLSFTRGENNRVSLRGWAFPDIQPLMDSHPLLEWMIRHPKMEADHPKHMKVGAFC